MSNISQNKIIAIVGTTASGKTGLGVKLAYKFQGEIVSADSRQVYKYMDVGTGKDLKDYSFKNWLGKEVNIPYYLIDIVDAREDFNLAQFQDRAYRVIEDILSRGKLPVVVGGTGLYAQALVEGYKLSLAGRDGELRKKAEEMTPEEVFKKIEQLNPDFAASINQSDQKNKVRLIRYWELLTQEENAGVFSSCPRYQSLVLGVTHPRGKLDEKIYSRLIQRLEQEGMVEEVKCLAEEKGLSWQRLERFGLEYKWVAYYLQGKVDYEEMVENLYTEIRKFSKKQLTWLKRWEKQGREIHWVKSKRGAVRSVRKYLRK